MPAYSRLTPKFSHRPPRPGFGLYYDPLYGYIPLPPYLRAITDVPMYQRMREIRQLSTVYLVYPGAVHTRFDHSVGVAYLAGLAHRILEEKVRNSKEHDAPQLNEVTRIALELAALLHDIGHGPFGHAFEQFCKRYKQYEEWNHEVIGRNIIRGAPDKFGSGIKLALERIRAEYNDSELLSSDNIAAIAFGRPELLHFGDDGLKRKYHFLCRVIPSAFGIDRLDYLKRDAFFSGLSTGAIDIWEILHSMTVRRQPEGSYELRLESTAALALEALLTARNFMYRRLYHDPVHRAAQELVIRAFSVLDAKPPDLGLMTDTDIINLLGESDHAFAKEIHARLRDRLLYEVIPLTSHGELRAIGARDLSYRNFPFADEHGGRDGETQVNVEKNLTENLLKLQGGQVLFDREQIPVVKLDDF